MDSGKLWLAMGTKDHDIRWPDKQTEDKQDKEMYNKEKHEGNL